MVISVVIHLRPAPGWHPGRQHRALGRRPISEACRARLSTAIMGGWGCGSDVCALGLYRDVRPPGEEALLQHEFLDLARRREGELLEHRPVARCLGRCEVLAAVAE